MSCFSLEYLGFHQIAYAHALCVGDYRFSFSTVGFGAYRAPDSELSGLMEIGYVVKNPLVIENHTIGRSYTAQEGDVFVFPPNHNISVHAQNPGEHRHITSEYLIDARVRPDADAGDAAEGRRLTLPYLLPAESVQPAVISLIHKIAADHTLLIEKSYFQQAAEFCSLLEALRRSSDPAELARPYLSPKYRAHCKKAEAYIESHISETIRIQAIADSIGISKNHLITIFPQYKDLGLNEYINRVKLNHLLFMMTRYGYSMTRACESVGYADVNYVSRIFHKYYGVSLSEYLRMTRSGSAK